MRDKFLADLLRLNEELVKMGALCEKAISMAVGAFLEDNEEYGKIAIRVEQEIDDKEQEIERACMKLLLHQQPVAKDLRLVSTALKMITDLERIGDQAADIAELSKYASGQVDNTHIRQMAEETVKMVTRAIDAFVAQDLEGAKNVIAYDDVVDNLFMETKADLVAKLVADGTKAEKILDLLMIAKYLERIADHGCNVAEWVVFSITGEHKSVG